MSTITSEHAELRAFITGFLSDPAHDNQSANSMTAEVFRIALASLEAEPVAYMTYKGYLLHADDPKVAEYSEPTPLYDAPPPAPVAVPDDVSGPLAHAYKELTPTFMRNHIDVFERYGIYPDGSAGIQAMRIALDGMNRRSAMLNEGKKIG